ncbi:MAG: NADP-dependent isocitrate dehydrogenase, partial [Spirochaetales bacterium]|nr:NADP-dependent isocitrate dehydrogenase [Spirochaetales bacterium]
GHAVYVYFKDALDKHADTLKEIGANVNNGLADILDKLDRLPSDKKAEIEADIAKVYETQPQLAMVDSRKGKTNLHVPNDVIVDASMPNVVRDGGKMWNNNDELQDVIAMVPDRSYAIMYSEIMEDAKANGQFDPSTMGNVANVGLMAQKAEEYGSHDKTFEAPSNGKISVIDTGIGIPEEKKNRLFKVFSQVDSSTTRKYGGSGLGLSISKNLVEMMGGEIGVESEFGKGSTFWFTAVMVKQINVDSSLWSTIPRINAKVLLVDDNVVIRGFLKSYLESAGCTVFEVSDGNTAIKFLKDRRGSSSQVDLCLIDLILPGMDGWQIASEIHSDSTISPVRRILLSPTGKSADEAKMKLLNWFDGYLHKPIKKGVFFKEIRKVLGNSDEILDEISPLEDLEELVEEIFTASILVAEDHKVNQILFKTILENIGHNVDIANNGLEAVEAVKLKSYDIIFMDVQMPEMNGYEATVAIRKLGSETPIIAVTASAIKGEREKCISVGMDDFLTKPFKKRDLIPVLDIWLNKENSADAELSQVDIPLSNTNLEVFDFSQAVEVFMGKEDIVINLLSDFIKKVEKQIEELYENCERNNFEELRQIAHSIKGGSSNLYIKRLSLSAKDLESAALEKNSDCRNLIDTLRDEFSRFLEAKSGITQ